MSRNRHFVLCAAFSWIACGERLLPVETGGNPVHAIPRRPTNHAKFLRKRHKLQRKLFSFPFCGNLALPANAPSYERGGKVMSGFTRENFWSGFAAGAALGALAGITGVLVARRRSMDIDSHVIRLEKSVNIGRPVQSVFAAWSSFERLPQWINFVRRVERYGTHTRWLVNIDGREFEWDAQITQVKPNEAIGWKSLNGPKHTGRITFSPLGNQTVVHVLMNYAPLLPGLGSMLPMEQHLELWIERGLREFKLALEREGSAREGLARDRARSEEREREFTSPGPGGETGRRGSQSVRDWEPLERTGTTDSGEAWKPVGPRGAPSKSSAPGTVSYTRPAKDK
jgi:uncharacterized membrane protein